MKVTITASGKKRIFFRDINVNHFIYGTQGPISIYGAEGSSYLNTDVRNFGITYLHEGNYAYWTYSRVYSLEEQ